MAEKKRATKTTTATPDLGPFTELMAEQLAGAEALWAELGRYHDKGFEQADAVLDEMARLTRSSMEHTKQVTEHWMKLALESSQKARSWLADAA